jgi:hypothetical protein
MVRNLVAEMKDLNRKKDTNTKPHKDNHCNTNVKDKDQHTGKVQQKYDIKRDTRNIEIKQTIKRNEDPQKKHARFSSLKEDRFSTIKDALDSI